MIERIRDSFPGYRARTVVGISMLILLLGLLLLGAELAWRFSWAHDRLAEVEPRYARLEGLVGEEQRLGRALEQTREALTRHAYPHDIPAERAGTDLQQRVRRLSDALGIGTMQSQILPVREGQVTEEIVLAVLLDSRPEALRDFLARLPALEPSVQVDALTLQGDSRREGSDRMRVELRLSAYRLLVP